MMISERVARWKTAAATILRRILGYPSIHPLMIAIAPIVILYSANAGEVYPSEIGIPIAIAIGVASTSLLLFWAIFRNLRKAAVVVSIALSLFFLYRIIQLGLGRGVAWDATWLLLAVWILLFVCGMYFTARTRSPLNNLTVVLNIVAISLILVPSVNVAISETRVAQKDDYVRSLQPMELQLSTFPDALPDIYYIILDRYASSGTLDKVYDFDNSEFIDFLSAKGFYVASGSHSNYLSTNQSLASSLNMEYLNYLAQGLGEDFGDLGPIYWRLQDNNVQHILKAQGYQSINIGSWWGPTMVNEFADENFNHASIPYFAQELFENTMVNAVSSQFGLVDNELSLHRNCMLYAYDKLAEIPSIEEPTFVFAHVLATHPPYVFDRNGRYLTEAEASVRGEKVNYVDQVLFTNERVMTLIDEILANSDVPPIIIIQADEGPYPEETGGSFDWRKATAAQLRQKTGILNAYYLPGVDTGTLYPTITPVNSFRVVLNLYFDADLELLPDSIYAVSPNRPYDFADVTGKLE